MRPWLLIALALTYGACTTDAPAPAPTWLESSPNPTEAIARQLRGFDVAMVEIDHRYTELYWAGEDRNWPYAEYQLQKMRLATDLALERRPKRGPSVDLFFRPVLDSLDAAVAAQDTARFARSFVTLTSTCNACHAAEGVPTFVVTGPGERASSIRYRP